MADKTGKLDPQHNAAIPNAKGFPGVDQYYQMYRYSILMASAPGDDEIPVESATADNPMIVPYSDEDEHMMDIARKLGGFGKPKSLSHGRSKETDDVHKISPVANLNKSVRKLDQ